MKKNSKPSYMLDKFDPDKLESKDLKPLFMALFAAQEQETRDSLLNDLPAFNALLSLKAESFEEIELRRIAQLRGVPYKKRPPVPDCPYCKSHYSVTKKTGYTYRCKTCKKTFSVCHNSIIEGLSYDALTVMKLFLCMLNFTSIRRTCEICGIPNKKTYYGIRNRIFYALQLLMDEVKLYGEVQVDNTFVRISYKGMDLHAVDVPEDSVFYEDIFKPRPGRYRGGAYRSLDLNANTIAVFTGIDDRAHVLARYVGIGATSFNTLKNYISTDKFLQEVPSADPFGDLMKPQREGARRQTGAASVIVSDKEKAIIKYANYLNIESYARVFRRNGEQIKVPEGSLNIQKVNALHSRLKSFLRKCNYVSSRYLPGYLLLFEYIENTGKSQKSIDRLFQILSTPGLGKNADFYQNMYAVPNYLLEWFSDDNALKKLPYNKLLAFFLYDQKLNKTDLPGSKMTMKEISEATGYTDFTIRKTYKDLKKANYRDRILEFFLGPEKAKANPELTSNKEKKTIRDPATFNPTVLSIYDEYARLRTLPRKQRPTIEEFLKEKNKQFGTQYKKPNMLAKFKMIEKSGVRPPMPELNREKPERYMISIDRAMLVLKDFEAIKLSYRERGEKPPKRDLILAELAQKYNVSPETISRDIGNARKYKREEQA